MDSPLQSPARIHITSLMQVSREFFLGACPGAPQPMLGENDDEPSAQAYVSLDCWVDM
jgi:hypothetical protein